MGSARTKADDLGLWVFLEGHVVESDVQSAGDDFDTIVGSFDGAFCAIVDGRRLETIEAEAMSIFENTIRENAPGRLKRLAVVCDGKPMEPHINLGELPPRAREITHCVDASRAPGWRREAMQWVRSGQAPEHSDS